MLSTLRLGKGINSATVNSRSSKIILDVEDGRKVSESQGGLMGLVPGLFVKAEQCHVHGPDGDWKVRVDTLFLLHWIHISQSHNDKLIARMNVPMREHSYIFSHSN